MKILNAILAHKDFTWDDIPENLLKQYKVFTPNKINTNIPNVCVFKEVEGYDNRIYSEFSHLKYIRDNEDFDWIIINHYRRRLLVTDFNNILIRESIKLLCSVQKQFEVFHSKEDLDLYTQIINESDVDEDFKIAWKESLDIDLMYVCNMVSCPKYIFDIVIDLICKIDDEFKKRKNIKTYEDVFKQYKNLYYQKCKFTKDPFRVIACLSERLFSAFFYYYTKQLRENKIKGFPLLECDVKLLENKMIM